MAVAERAARSTCVVPARRPRTLTFRQLVDATIATPARRGPATTSGARPTTRATTGEAVTALRAAARGLERGVIHIASVRFVTPCRLAAAAAAQPAATIMETEMVVGMGMATTEMGMVEGMGMATIIRR